MSLRSASVYTHDSPRENALYSSNATLKKDGRKKKTERKKMPTLLTWSRWTPPFLGLGPAISGRPGELRIPWAGAGGGERSPYHSRNSLPGSPCAWRRGVGAGIGWVGGQRTVTQTQMGACRAWRGGRWSGREGGRRGRAEQGPGRLHSPDQAPTLLRGPQHLLAGHGPGAALAEAGV